MFAAFTKYRTTQKQHISVHVRSSYPGAFVLNSCQHHVVPFNREKDVVKELYELPDHLKAIMGASNKKNENMLSNQMLSGIPEIDLGIE